MASKAYTIFTATHDRGVQMVDSSVMLWKTLNGPAGAESPDPTDDEFNTQERLADMARAGVVIGVSAFDDFFTRRFSECVVPLIKSGNANKPLLQFLERSGLDVSTALKLLTMDRPYRRIRKLVNDALERKTTQKFSTIDTLFKCIGLQTLSNDVQVEANRTTLKRSCEILIKRRHAIAHQGDMNKHGSLTKLSYKKVQKRLKDIRLFVDTANDLITAKVT